MKHLFLIATLVCIASCARYPVAPKKTNHKPPVYVGEESKNTEGMKKELKKQREKKADELKNKLPEAKKPLDPKDKVAPPAVQKATPMVH